MTKEPAGGNGLAMPVTTYENNAVNGFALCGQFVLEEHNAEVQKLRARQAAYLASLPTDPAECMHAAWRVLHHNNDEFPEGFEDALHLARAIGPMVRHLEVEVPGPDRDAFLYIARRICDGLEQAAAHITHASKILASAKRAVRA